MITFAPSFTGCPDGGIGRRAGLKHQWIHFHAGSTPALGTFNNANNHIIRLLALLHLKITCHLMIDPCIQLSMWSVLK